MKGVDKAELVYSGTVTVETVKGYDGLRSERSVEVQELATFCLNVLRVGLGFSTNVVHVRCRHLPITMSSLSVHSAAQNS
jgi:hypothetical protein